MAERQTRRHTGRESFRTCGVGCGEGVGSGGGGGRVGGSKSHRAARERVGWRGGGSLVELVERLGQSDRQAVELNSSIKQLRRYLSVSINSSSNPTRQCFCKFKKPSICC